LEALDASSLQKITTGMFGFEFDLIGL